MDATDHSNIMSFGTRIKQKMNITGAPRMLNLSKSILSILSIQSNIQSEKLCFYLVQREEVHSVLRYFVPHFPHLFTLLSKFTRTQRPTL